MVYPERAGQRSLARPNLPRVAKPLSVLAAALTLALPAAPADAHTLPYTKARAAAQRTADRFADQRTEITSLRRPPLAWATSRLHRYDARAEWDYVDPTGCKGCVYDETTGTFKDGPKTVQCEVTVIVRYRNHRARRPVAQVDEHTCI